MVVVAEDDIERVVQKSRAREKKENAFREKIRNGVTTVKLLPRQETLRRFNLD